MLRVSSVRRGIALGWRADGYAATEFEYYEQGDYFSAGPDRLSIVLREPPVSNLIVMKNHGRDGRMLSMPRFAAQSGSRDLLLERVRRSNSMQPELEPIDPREALELYIKDRRGDLRAATIWSHQSRSSIFVDWCIEDSTNRNELTGRTIHKYKIWRREEGDLSKATLKTQIDTVRAFIKWLEDIDGCPPDLHAKIKSPSPSADENTRDVELHTEEAEQVLTYLEKYEYANLQQVTLTLLWHTMMRRGAARALDLRDYHRDELYLKIVHRPQSETPLKNGTGGEYLVAVSNAVAALLDDWIDEQRPAVTDEYGRDPLLATSQGRLHATTIQQYAYMATRPCAYGTDCPHDRDPDTCEAAVERYEASKCPSSVSPRAIRRGSITHWLREDVPAPAISGRADVSADVLSQHYGERTDREKMERRRHFLDTI